MGYAVSNFTCGQQSGFDCNFSFRGSVVLGADSIVLPVQERSSGIYFSLPVSGDSAWFVVSLPKFNDLTLSITDALSAFCAVSFAGVKKLFRHAGKYCTRRSAESCMHYRRCAVMALRL